jgi:methoxymalonate biosynthesis acyl carrier protein
MDAQQDAQTLEPAALEIRDGLLGFLGERVKATVTPEQDMFAAGLVSSMFAMQLVVHLEEAYGIAVVGSDLKLDNFRTVDAMTALVLRLREQEDGTGDA